MQALLVESSFTLGPEKLHRSFAAKSPARDDKRWKRDGTVGSARAVQSAAANSEDGLAEAMQARLEVIQQELMRLSELASNAPDSHQQEQYWELARDLQREARNIRATIQSRSQDPKIVFSKRVSAFTNRLGKTQ